MSAGKGVGLDRRGGGEDLGGEGKHNQNTFYEKLFFQ